MEKRLEREELEEADERDAVNEFDAWEDAEGAGEGEADEPEAEEEGNEREAEEEEVDAGVLRPRMLVRESTWTARRCRKVYWFGYLQEGTGVRCASRVKSSENEGGNYRCFPRLTTLSVRMSFSAEGGC